MGPGEIAQNPKRPGKAPRWAALAAWRRERARFWLWVGLAALVHGVVIFGASRSLSTRNMGDPEGSQGGLSVELVDAADLESRTSVPVEPPPGAPAQPPSPAQPPPVEEKPPEPQEARPEPAAEEPKTATSSIDKEEALAIPPVEGPAEQPIEKAPPKEAKKAKETKEPKETKEKTKPERDALRLSMPALPNPSYVPGGRAPAAVRPPNITRSGENDDFGRGVIRALRQTMPQVNWLGRVSIRLLLTDKGNIQEVQLIRSGGDPVMDQNVVFAARQSNFPIPPANSTEADRTFYVTYVYH
jgi:periplasmic protein TonB